MYLYIYMENNFRKFDINTRQYQLYKNMYKNQCIDFVIQKRLKYSKFETKMSIKKALLLLDTFIDPSDPDLDVPNSIHAYQTAERIRKNEPNNEELIIIGLIHDLGKVLFSFGEESYSVVGDTYVLGCKFPKSIVYNELLEFSSEYKKYDNFGIYKKNCGLENLYLSYGHDEYLYQVLKFNKNHKISNKYLNIIRYHSFYPWHTGGDYKEFMIDSDKIILEDVNNFNKYDLYSKEDNINITNETKSFYNKLLDKYFLGDLYW
jgi:inositol oxygenase